MLYRTLEGRYFLVERIEEPRRTQHAISVLNAHEAHQIYLAIPVHLVDEDRL